jgi:hypothetical protein
MCNPADLVRILEGYDLRRHRAINLNFGFIPKGLYQKPFVIDFSKFLKDMSKGAIDLDAVNAYTVGDYAHIDDNLRRSSRYSNFLDPRCRFKDSWFGVYFIFDDAQGRGRRFVLQDPNGPPDDFGNMKPDALSMVPSMDQKLIVFSTHDGQKGYSMEQFEREFYFRLKPGTEMTAEPVVDGVGRSWVKVSATYESISALTDTRKTNMGMLSSLRCYIGLPTDDVYALVDPWHAFDLPGCVMVRYFARATNSFWAMAYYNGSTFVRKDGFHFDPWRQTDLRSLMEQMFLRLELNC